MLQIGKNVVYNFHLSTIFFLCVRDVLPYAWQSSARRSWSIIVQTERKTNVLIVSIRFYINIATRVHYASLSNRTGWYWRMRSVCMAMMIIILLQRINKLTILAKKKIQSVALDVCCLLDFVIDFDVLPNQS